jgi:dTDP-4-dehydrorhamnose reductase
MSAKKILILGATGQVGLELRRSFADLGEVMACDRGTADLGFPEQIEKLIDETGPEIVLNAAAYTAVDKAETEPELAMTINAHAVGAMARACARRDALLVSYSTDYVFDGTKQGAWLESDAPNPLNVYGKSKLAGELAIEQAGGRHLILRTSWVYGPHGKNFYLTMLRLAKEKDQLGIVADQFGAPTSSIAIADATRAILDRAEGAADWSGVYHLTCQGKASWFEFAQLLFARSLHQTEGRQPELRPLRSEEYPTPARRPGNSVLDNGKLERTFGVRLPAWQDAFDIVQKRMPVTSYASR